MQIAAMSLSEQYEESVWRDGGEANKRGQVAELAWNECGGGVVSKRYHHFSILCGKYDFPLDTWNDAKR